MASGPLDGIRVLEFTQIIAGPFGCQNLADMGAEVIKVEPPGGEPWRLFSQFMPGESKTFQSLNRGKKSLVLSMQEPDAQEIVHRLIPSVDVVVINYRPDVPAKLGIDYETLSGIRPSLIYVDNTAWGRRGPWALRPGYDIVAQAVSGLMIGEGKIDPAGAPMSITSTAIADYGTGVAIAWSVCAALFHRERTGEGQMIETTLLHTALAFQGTSAMDLPAADALKYMKMDRVHELQQQHASYSALIEAYQMGNIARVGNIYYRCYATSDGAVAVGALSPTLWAKVRAAVGTDFLGMADPAYNMTDPVYAEMARRRVAEVEEIFRGKTTAEWLAILEQNGVPSGPLNFVDDMLSDPQVVANDIPVTLEHELSGPQTQVGPMLRMSKTPLAAQGPSPVLGKHTDEIVSGLGYSAEQRAALRARNVIG
ncbi:MAG: CoA transferase [Dehalococcoidia bacterium]|nr:MAG: CoA transferase [Dehalococcoidia bacterium]